MSAPATIEEEQTKIDALNKEAWDVRVSDSARAFSLSGEAVELAKRVGYKKGLAEGLRTCGFAHIRLSKLNEAKGLLEEALRLFDEAGDENGQSDVYEYYGIIERSHGNFDVSLEHLYQSLDLREKTNYREGLSLSHYHLGVTYKYLGEYEKALHSLLQSLHVAREIRYWIAESYSLNLIGQIYFETADYQQSLHYYQQSLQMRQSLGDKWGEAGCLDNIGFTFYKLGEVEKAVHYCAESLGICRTTGDRKGQANALFHLSELYNYLGEKQNALNTASESLHIRRELDDKKGMAEVLIGLAHTAERPKKALSYLTEALRLGNEIKAQDLLANIQFQFYNCYKQSGDYQKALESLEIFNRLEKELHRDALAEKVVNLQITHRFEQAKKEADAYRQRNDELAALNEALQKQKEETEAQKLVAETSLHQLKETQAQLVQKEKMASLGELTAGIAHEIQNPLNFVNNFSEVNSELLSEAEGLLLQGLNEEALACLKDLKENEQKITYHGRRADAIVKGMLQHSRTGSGKKEPANINDLAAEYLRLAFHGMRAKDNSFNATVETYFDSSLDAVNVVPQAIGRVLLNLFNNAFYAVEQKKKQGNGNYNPVVSVHTKKEGNRVVIIVRDNGIGIPQQVSEKVFQPFFTTKPTGEGTGLGLSLSYDIVTKGHGGELKVESKEGEGAAFTVLLPVQNKKMV